MIFNFLETPRSFRPHILGVESLEISSRWHRPVAAISTLIFVVFVHGLIYYRYWMKPEPPPLRRAIPLSTIDITLASPPNKAVMSSTLALRQPETKHVTKPDWVPPRNPKLIHHAKKAVSHAIEPEPPPLTSIPSSTPQASSVPTQERVVPPPPEEYVPPTSNANYLNNPIPEYPSLARSRRWEGEVLLRVYVKDDGHCGDLSVQTSSGHEELDQAALEAVKHWRFIPAKRGEVSIASWVTVPISFKLDS